MPEPLGRITTYSSVISARYNPDKFVGREWLKEEVIRFRDHEERRHLIIVGEPGSGKSAFLAYLAVTLNCPRHFIRVGSIDGVTGVDPRHFLVSLGAQLYQKYGRLIFEQAEEGNIRVTVGFATGKKEIVGRFIDELYTLPFLPPSERDVQVKVGAATGHSQIIGEHIGKLINIAETLDETTLLHLTLLNPLQKIQELYPAEKVVILIDALDEAHYHSGVKIPDILPRATDADVPANLRLVMTSRLGHVADKFRREDRLELDDANKGFKEENLRDIRTYITRQLDTPPFAEVTRTWSQLDKQAYQHEVEVKSEGNFLYLYHFFNELAAAIKAGQTDLRSFKIPRGLDEIYRSFAVDKIRQQTEDSIQFTILGIFPPSFHSQLEAIPTVTAVEINGQSVTLTTTDSDSVMFSLPRVLYDAGVHVTAHPRTRKAEQLGVWEEKYLPVLGVLAVAFEALRLEQIAGYARVEVVYVETILTSLQQFLDNVVDGSTTSYQWYHLSFNEYLLDHRRNQDYPLDASLYHYQIASYYRGNHASWEEVIWSAVQENYPFSYLVAHLAASGRSEEVHRLLASETNEQRNAWYEAKEARGDVSEYVADVRRAWELAESAYKLTDIPQTGRNISLQCRYALIVSSLNSLIQNISSQLLHFLIKQKIWTLKRGMMYARQVLGGYERVQSMVAVLPLIENKAEQMDWFRETLANVEAVGGKDNDRFELLLKLVTMYPDPKSEEIIKTVLALIPEDFQPWAYIALTPYLSEALLREYLVILQQSGKHVLLATLAHRLPELDPMRQAVFKEILAAARQSDDLYEREGAFSALAKYQSIAELNLLAQDILAAARTTLLEEDFLLLVILERVLPYLSGAEQEQALQELLLAIESSGEEVGEKWKRLGRLCTHLPLPLCEKVLTFAQQIKEEYLRIRALVILIPYFEEERREALLKEVVAVVCASKDEGWQSLAEEIGRLAPYMSPMHLQKILDVAKHVWKDRWRVQALAGLAVPLTGQERETVLKEAIEFARSIPDNNGRIKALEWLAPLLTVPLLRDALTAAQTINDGIFLLDGLPILFAGLPDPEKEKAWRLGLEVTTGLYQEWRRAKLVSGLAPSLPVSLETEALNVARGFEQTVLRAETLPALASFIPKPERQAALEEAWNAAKNTFYVSGKFELLVSLIPLFSLSERKRVIQQTLNEVDEIYDPELKAPCLAQLAFFLPSVVRERVIRAVIEEPAWNSSGRGVLQTLAPCLPKKLVWALLHSLALPLRSRDLGELFRGHPFAHLGFSVPDNEKERVYLALTARLAELGDPMNAFKIVKFLAIGDLDLHIGSWKGSEGDGDAITAKGLAALAPHLPSPLVREALNIVLQLSDSAAREHAISELCVRLMELDDQVIDILSPAHAIKNPFWRARALIRIAAIKEGQQDQLLREALAAAKQIKSMDEYREIITSLSLQLAKWPSSRLCEIWRAIFTQGASSRTRQNLVPNLYCLTPVVATLGGTEALAGVFQAIMDVRRWWP
jgi:hypothetical protein